MDYEKKYNEAIKRAKQHCADYVVETIFPELKESEDKKPNGAIVMEDFNEGNGFYKVNLAYLNKEQVEEIEGLVKKWIPEFAESEDEKIRKALIEGFNKLDKSAIWYNGITNGQILSWLEKQGENQNNVYDKELSEILGCVIRRYINDPNIPYTEREKVSMEIIPYVEKLEKQGEPQDVSIQINPSEYINDMGGNGCYLKNTTQKPAEEIEPTPIFRIGDILKRKGKDYTFRVDRIRCGYYYSDRNRGAFFPIEEQGNWELVEQKPAWSEEDDIHFDRILKELKEQKQRPINYPYLKDIDSDVDWLKSLKDRYTWKPSEEMLEALYRVIPENMMEKSEDEMLLDKLYQGLKYGKVLSEK